MAWCGSRLDLAHLGNVHALARRDCAPAHSQPGRRHFRLVRVRHDDTRALTLRMHAFNLSSRFDVEGENPWSAARTREFFVRETPHQAYVNRIRAVRNADYRQVLNRINVPTLILTPEEDRLIGREAAQILLNGIRGSVEVVLPRTGHMFRFSHPGAYSSAVAAFLHKALAPGQA